MRKVALAITASFLTITAVVLMYIFYSTPTSPKYDDVFRMPTTSHITQEKFVVNHKRENGFYILTTMDKKEFFVVPPQNEDFAVGDTVKIERITYQFNSRGVRESAVILHKK